MSRLNVTLYEALQIFLRKKREIVFTKESKSHHLEELPSVQLKAVTENKFGKPFKYCHWDLTISRIVQGSVNIPSKSSAQIICRKQGKMDQKANFEANSHDRIKMTKFWLDFDRKIFTPTNLNVET